MLKDWSVDYMVMGIEPHRTTTRNTSRHSYIVGKLKMRISHLKKLVSDVDTYCFTHQGDHLESVRQGLDMRLKQCKALLSRLMSIAPVEEDDDGVSDPDQGETDQGDTDRVTDDSCPTSNKAAKKRCNISNSTVAECMVC